MEISFVDLKEKEIVNVFDGRKLGHIIDIVFDINTGIVQGVFVPGEKKFFRKSEDVFVPLEKIKKIGDDVVLVKLQMVNENIVRGGVQNLSKANSGYMMNNYYQNYGLQNNNRTQNVIDSKYEKLKNGSDLKTSYVRFKPINKIKYK